MKSLPFIIVLLIFIIPFPIKVTFKYADKKLGLYLYNKKINLDKIKQKKKKKTATKKENKEISYIGILNDIKNIKFKPSLKFKLYFEYGTDDAAETALLYGGIWTLIAFIYQSMLWVFNIKKFDCNIIPNFNDEKLIISIQSIIFISLVKVIYICIIFFKNIKRSENYG